MENKSLLQIAADDVKAVKGMSADQLKQLAKEVRVKLIDTVSKTGGHLASNLGAVELTLALLYVLDVPEDKIRSRYARTMSRLGRYLELADEAVVIDNGGEHPVVVLLKDGDGIGFPSVVPDWLREHVPDNPVN